MPEFKPYEQITLTAGGGTVNLKVDSLTPLYYISGTATLLGSWVIQPDPGSTNPLIKGMVCVIDYKAVITLGVNTLTLFGQAIPKEQALKPGTFICTYDGSDWNVTFAPTIGQNIVYGDNSSITGDGTPSNPLVAASSSLLNGHVQLVQDDILNLLTVPFEMIAAPGTGKAIHFLGGFGIFTAGTDQYTVSGSGAIDIAYEGVLSLSDMVEAAIIVASGKGVLAFTNNPTGSSAGDIENVGIIIQTTNTLAFADGNGVLDLYFQYRIVTL